MIFLSLPPPQYFKAWNKNTFFKNEFKETFLLKRENIFPQFLQLDCIHHLQCLVESGTQCTNQFVQVKLYIYIELELYKVHFKSRSFACNCTLLAHGVDDQTLEIYRNSVTLTSAAIGLGCLPNQKPQICKIHVRMVKFEEASLLPRQVLCNNYYKSAVFITKFLKILSAQFTNTVQF